MKYKILIPYTFFYLISILLIFIFTNPDKNFSFGLIGIYNIYISFIMLYNVYTHKKENQDKNFNSSSIYSKVRFPIYSSSYHFCSGIAFFFFNFYTILSIIIFYFIITLLIYYFEEIDLVEKYGFEYSFYIKKVNRILPPLRNEKYVVNYFNLDDKLINLILNNKKVATSSLALEYIKEDEKLPELNQYSFVKDNKNNIRLVIQIVDIKTLKFNEFTEELAILEGEGNLSNWKKEHKKFFSKVLKKYDLEFREDIDIVFEKFKLVENFYKE